MQWGGATTNYKTSKKHVAWLGGNIRIFLMSVEFPISRQVKLNAYTRT